MRPVTQDPIVCDVQDPTRPTVVDSESDADDERLPVGAVPEDVIVALDLCSESSVVVGDAEVFVLTDDAPSVHGRTSGIPSGLYGPGSIRMSHAASDSHSVDKEENKF